MKLRRCLPFLFFSLTLAGCATRPADDGALLGTPFYEELGGQAGIEALVDALLVRIAEDPRIVDRFAMTDVRRLRTRLVLQFCSLSGGPCVYDGDSMRDVHRTQGIDAGEFDALVRDLMQAMEDVGTPAGARNRLLGRLAPMYADIVER